jgi:hypothetical protein
VNNRCLCGARIDRGHQRIIGRARSTITGESRRPTWPEQRNSAKHQEPRHRRGR